MIGTVMHGQLLLPRSSSSLFLVCKTKLLGVVCFGGADTLSQHKEMTTEGLISWSLIGSTADKDKNPATEAEGPAALDTTGRMSLALKDRSREEWPSLTSRYC